MISQRERKLPHSSHLQQLPQSQKHLGGILLILEQPKPKHAAHPVILQDLWPEVWISCITARSCKAGRSPFHQGRSGHLSTSQKLIPYVAEKAGTQNIVQKEKGSFRTRGCEPDIILSPISNDCWTHYPLGVWNRCSFWKKVNLQRWQLISKIVGCIGFMWTSIQHLQRNMGVTWLELEKARQDWGKQGAVGRCPVRCSATVRWFR